MTKIMLVEDDKSLREIYGVRLLAEGYEIASAGDGEEALAMAVKEHPDLIISDVMMPKISGFDMLDIIRATPETKDIKIIMMTALSSEDQRTRGESLGANRYLVKSQVGIEDVVRTVHEVLADSPISAVPASRAFGAPVSTATINTQPTPASQQPQPAQTIQPQQSTQPANEIQPQTVAMPQPTAPFSSSAPASLVNQFTDSIQQSTAPVTPPVQPSQSPTPQQTQTQPAEMFKTYNPAMQAQQYAPHPSVQPVVNSFEPTTQQTATPPTIDIAALMADELNKTETPQAPVQNNQINPPQL